MKWPFVSGKRYHAERAAHLALQSDLRAQADRAHNRAQGATGELVRMAERIAITEAERDKARALVKQYGEIDGRVYSLEQENAELKNMLMRCRYHARRIAKKS